LLDLVGCGGLIRDYNNQWLTRYVRKIGTCDAFYVEMWDMNEGLKIARRQGFLQLIVESDSKLLVDIVTSNCKLSGVSPILSRHICDLIDLPWQVHGNHTWREGNRSADWLAAFSRTKISFTSIILQASFRACMLRNILLIL